MSNKMKPIISINELLKRKDNSDLVLIDSRYPQARKAYEQQALQGALFVDLDQDLATIQEDVARGGRHPLISTQGFLQTLKKLGINQESHVVIYDNNGGAFSARFWWMLRSIGHANVQVLDGSFDQAVAMGFPTSPGKKPSHLHTNYTSIDWLWPTSSMVEVEKVLQDKSAIVVDVRGGARFKGEVEPIDLIAGHIPGAVNIPFADNLNHAGNFKTPFELKTKYQEAFGEIGSNEIIVQCGSGVTACHTILAMDIAGLKIPKLYVGSWSEWSRNNKPIATGV